MAKKIGVSPKEIRVRKMKRKMARCSSRGRITISEKPIYMDESKRAEIIVHGLLHLRYPNHGRMFKCYLRK